MVMVRLSASVLPFTCSSVIPAASGRLLQIDSTWSSTTTDGEQAQALAKNSCYRKRTGRAYEHNPSARAPTKPARAAKIKKKAGSGARSCVVATTEMSRVFSWKPRPGETFLLAVSGMPCCHGVKFSCLSPRALVAWCVLRG